MSTYYRSHYRPVERRARPSETPPKPVELRDVIDASVLSFVRRRPSGDFATPAWIAAIGLPIVVLFMALTAVNVGGFVVLWENAHWTTAGLLATMIAASATRESTGLERRLRGLIALSAGTWLVGQVCWDAQTVAGFFGIPAPSDAGYLLAVVPAIVALVVLVRGRLSHAEEIAVYLDAAAIFLAITAVVLQVFGADAAKEGLLEGAIVVAYPIIHLATAGAGLVGLLAVRATPRPAGGYLLLGAWALLGVAWVGWLAQAVVALPPAGSLVNYGFSFAIVGVGIGGATWRLRDLDRPATRAGTTSALGVLPLVALGMSAFVLLGRHLTAPGLGLVDVAALASIVLTGSRQTLLVHERGRLLDDSHESRQELEVALLRRAEADSRYQVLVEHVPAAVYIDVADDDVSDGGRLAYLSPQIEAMVGHTAEAFLADPELWPGLIHADDREAAIAAYQEHWESGSPLRIEYRMIARDGSIIWVRDEAFAMVEGPGGGRRVSQGILVDTTDQKRLEAQLLHDALHDPLTGLANRVLFREHVERALGRRKRRRTTVALLFLDLDDFKVVNDSLGHRAGDRLLVEVANRLSEAIRGADVAARQGGDEFTVLLDRVQDVRDATATADRLAARLRQPIELEGRSIVINASIGIALATAPDTIADDLLAHADAAMYAAKAHGKGRHAVFDPSMRVRVRARSRLEMEAELRSAIEQQAFELHYQPIVELPARRIVGFEALVRWRHDERGLVPPSEFIPLAEATGLIVPLGRLVTTQACRQLRAWRDAAAGRDDLTMSVNISPRQAVEPGFAGEVKAILEAEGLPPRSLVLEITESLMLGDSATTDGSLKQLRELGVQLAIDDFGTGFSALEYFKRFAVHSLKIDRSFIAGLGRSPEDTAIVTATLAFASALGLGVTAEGVETAEQLERLQSLGCQRAQGYLFAHPVPSEETPGLLDSVVLPNDSEGVRAA